MDNNFLKRYLKHGVIQVLIFIGLLLMCIVGAIIIDSEASAALILPGMVAGGLYLIPGVYYIIRYFSYKKHLEQMSVRDGVIWNWELGYLRTNGAVAVKEDDREYLSSAIFSRDEAKDMVGSTISYAIVDDELVIIQVK